MRARLSVAVTVLTATLATGIVTANPAAADRECHWDPIAGLLVCDNEVPGGPPGGGGGSGGSSSPLGRWFVWINDIVPDPGNPCPADPATGQVPQRRFLQFLPAGNPAGVTTVNNWCPPTVVAIPPPPPTPAELRGLAQAPAPPVNISPDGRGVTGLPTRLWGDPPAPVVVGPLVLRSWSVTGTAGPTLWEWTMGSTDGTRNPDPYLSSTRAGSESDPAALYTYETKGGFTVVATVSYNGMFTVAGPYGVSVSANVGSIAVSSSRSYDVVEVRSARD